MEHQINTQTKTIEQLTSHRQTMSKTLEDQGREIGELEVSRGHMKTVIDEKGQESISLKLHNSRDDSTGIPFQEVCKQSRQHHDAQQKRDQRDDRNGTSTNGRDRAYNQEGNNQKRPPPKPSVF